MGSKLNFVFFKLLKLPDDPQFPPGLAIFSVKLPGVRHVNVGRGMAVGFNPLALLIGVDRNVSALNSKTSGFFVRLICYVISN